MIGVLDIYGFEIFKVMYKLLLSIYMRMLKICAGPFILRLQHFHTKL